MNGDVTMDEKSFWTELKSGKFAKLIKESSENRKITNSDEVYNVMKPLFMEEDDVEKMYGLFMNSMNHVLKIELLASGTLGESSVYPREIVKKIIQHKANYLIIAHNHPSGNVAPSPEDRMLTKAIIIATKAIDSDLLDHVIIGGSNHYSFRQTDLFTQMKADVQKMFKICN
jgi:DNA repair protein RadC